MEEKIISAVRTAVFRMIICVIIVFYVFFFCFQMEEKVISLESQLKSSETKYTTVQKQLSEVLGRILDF